MALLTEHEQRQIAEAIARVECQTDAELVTVLAARADDYAYLPLLWASLLALVVPAVVHFAFGWLSTYGLLALQWSCFILLCLLFRLPFVTARLIPRRMRYRRGAQLARRQFIEQKLHDTAGRTGLLIFVSVAERYVQIIADEGIARRFDSQAWDAIAATFTRQVEAGQTLQGFVSCIEACGELLKTQLPLTLPHARNQLPNRLVLLG